MKHFDGELLKQTLKMRGVTQRALAKEIYTSEKTITSWVRGYGEPSGSMLMNIAHFLKVDPLIFMRTEYKMKQPKAPCNWAGKNCPDRNPGCHSPICTHGWTEYENQMKAYRKVLDEDVNKKDSIREYEKAQAKRIAKRTQ